ncbi:MAG: hypothetical protein V3V03_09845 [Hyphomonadaceae bacterium]
MGRTVFLTIGVVIAVFCKRYFFADITGLEGFGLAVLLGGIGGGIGGGLGAWLFPARKDDNSAVDDK